MTTILILLIAGVLGGVLLGLLGVGMALVAVPALVFSLPLLGVPAAQAPLVALATSMGIVTIGSLSAVTAHHRMGNVDWALFRRIVPFSLIGLLAGSALVTVLPPMALRVIFAAFLVFIAARMLRGRKPSPGAGSARHDRLAGAAIGTAGALIGAGGGVFMVPYLSARGVSMVRAVASSAAIGLPVTVLGFVFHALRPLEGIAAPMLGSVHLPALIGLGLGGVIGAPFGARLAARLPGEALKKGFAVLLLVLAAALALGS